MIRSIWLKNFRSFGPKGGSVDLGRVTFIFGPNGSGKTSVWWVPALFSQTWATRSELAHRAGVFQRDEPLHIPRLQELFHGARDDGSFEIGVGLDVDASMLKLALNRAAASAPALRDLGDGSVDVRMECRTAMLDRLPDWSLTIRLGQNLLFRCSYPGRLLAEGFDWQKAAYQIAGIDGPIRFRPGSTWDWPWKAGVIGLAQAEDSYAPGRAPHLDAAARLAAEVLELWGSALVERFFPVDAERGLAFMQRSIGFETGVIRRVGADGSLSIPFLSQLASDHDREDDWKAVQRWCGAFGLNDPRISTMHRDQGGKPLPAGESDVRYQDPMAKPGLGLWASGHGSRLVLPVIAQLFAAPPDATIFVDEPDLSLHPAAQILFLEMVAERAASGRQVAIATHSTVLANELHRLVAQGGLQSSDVKVYELKRGPEGTVVVPLELEPTGLIKGWVPSFAEVDTDGTRRWLSKVVRPAGNDS